MMQEIMEDELKEPTLDKRFNGKIRRVDESFCMHDSPDEGFLACVCSTTPRRLAAPLRFSLMRRAGRGFGRWGSTGGHHEAFELPRCREGTARTELPQGWAAYY